MLLIFNNEGMKIDWVTKRKYSKVKVKCVGRPKRMENYEDG